MPLILVAFLGLAARVAAQIGKTTVHCSYAEWTSFKGNSACQLWANLQAACDSNASVGVLNTTSNPNAQYPVPSGSNATSCQCNVVAYNLMAGCSWCQPFVYSDNWVTEAKWRAGCSDYNPSGLPFQAASLSSQIPPWAFTQENGAAWLAFEASSIAAAGTSPTSSVTSRLFGPSATGFLTGTGLATPFPATPSIYHGDGGHNDVSFNDVDLGKAIGIPLGVIWGSYLILGAIVLAVFATRQNNRQAWYRPMAQFYRDGNHMISPAQQLLNANIYGQQQTQNPFTTLTTSPATAQYDPNALYGHGGQGYNHEYFNPHATSPGTYHNVNQQQAIQV